MIRWLSLSILTLIIIVMRTARNGFFHGKDWILYLILVVSISFVVYYRRK